MKRRILGALLLILILALTASTALAQNYYFSVPRAEVTYAINQDGTASVEYIYEFDNTVGGDAIDFIDIGTPTNNYSLSGIEADVNGAAITDIQKSDYIDQGIALGLGSNAIQPGQTGRVTVFIPTIRDVIYNADRDTGKENYAGFQFEPNTFGDQFVTGQTNMTVTLVLPPGMNSDQPIYYTPERWPGTSEPESGFTQDGRVFYRWNSANASIAQEYVFGAGFPKEVVPENAIVTPGATINFDSDILCCIPFALLFAGITGFGIWQGQRRKMQYLPPKVAVEGHGIKRGLTPVEAGILMQQPMDKILTMVLFSVIKKGVARVTSRDPLKVEVSPTLPEGLNTYEVDFLTAMKEDNPRQRRTAMQTMVIGLVKSVTEKMRGFSRKETIDYYENIMKQAWAQVEGAGTPEVKSEKYEEVMDWTMLDRDYSGRTREVFRTGPVILPGWWGRYDPTYSSGPSTAGTSLPRTSTGGGQISLPHLPGSDFAASMVNGVESFAGNVLGDVGNFTSGVTNKTNPVPVSTSSSRGGGSHRSGGCACACACASCACACAGGGR